MCAWQHAGWRVVVWVCVRERERERKREREREREGGGQEEQAKRSSKLRGWNPCCASGTLARGKGGGRVRRSEGAIFCWSWLCGAARVP